MTKVSRRVISVALALLMVLTIMPMVNIKAKAATGVEDFVARCYSVALGRAGDAEGINYWVGEINGKKRTGVDVVYNFIFSEEYKNQKTSDEKFVNDLYTMFMGRPADQSGYDYWCGQLKEGKERKDIFTGFANSQEFYETCANYGITAGFYTDTVPLSQLSNINLFVARMYETTLGRLGDPGGQKYWTEGLASGELTGIGCAVNFIQSKEYTSKNLSDEEYVENLYAAFMGRPSDAAGKANWVNGLKSGEMTRDMVFAGFANSAEFEKICSNYAIESGKYEPKDIIDDSPRTLRQVTVRNGEYVVTINDYDVNGNIVKSAYVFLIASGYHYETEYFYNEKGLKIRELFSETLNNSTTKRRTEFTYNSAGKVLTQNSYDEAGNSRTTTTYVYDENGNIATVTSAVTGASSDYKTIAYYESDTNGNPVKITSKDGAGNITSVEEYKYNANGDTIEWIHTNYSSGVAESTYVRVLEYDANGNNTVSCEYEGRDKKKLTSKTEYTYDRWGNRKTETPINISTNKPQYVITYENMYY